MDSDHHDHQDHRDHRGAHAGRWVFLGFALVAGYFLFTEHRAHLFGVLPYLLVLACPLMHLFHRHGGHGHCGHAKPDHSESDAGADAAHRRDR